MSLIGSDNLSTQPMCIAVFLWRCHPLYQLILLHNRDEYLGRPAEALDWWESGGVLILGGRDVSAGGTWLASSLNGRMAFLTNFWEVEKIPQAKTRGNLPVRFLQSKKSPLEFAQELGKEAQEYNGFNLIVADFPSGSMFFISNRPKADSGFFSEVPPGIHVLTNASLDSPWPKAQRLRDGFEKLLDTKGGGELPIKEMADSLMVDNIKNEDQSLLPGIYPPEMEYETSSVFVNYNSPEGKYGTRSTSAVSVRINGELSFYERHLEDGSWKQKTLAFFIEAD